MMFSPSLSSLACLRCGQAYPPFYQNTNKIRYQCDCRPNKLSDLGTLDVRLDYELIRKQTDPGEIISDFEPTIGRYAPLLPIVKRTSLPQVAVGNTPLTLAKKLGELLGPSNIYIKDDGRNPSGSLKDRASAIAVAIAQENCFPIVATASTGNAAAALAGQSASAAQKSVIFVPKSAPPAKIAQLRIYGSHVLIIDGTYDQAFDLCTSACEKFGWFNRNTGLNPYMTEGKKTVSYEIAEQLATHNIAYSGSRSSTGSRTYFQAPDAVFVSVGDGCIIGGVHKGFKDLVALGWIDKMPRLYGIQSELSPALTNAWRSGDEYPEPVNASTRADSISVNSPRDPIKALNAVRQTGGAFITVPDEAILNAMLPLARLGGIFGEPAGAAALAGLQQAVKDNLVDPDETIVVINTGNGLKDVNAAIQVTSAMTPIEPTMERVIDEVTTRGIV